MTDPLAPYDPGCDPLAPPPVAPPASARPGPSAAPSSPKAPEPPAPESPPRFERPGTSRPGGVPVQPGTSRFEAGAVDLPPLPKRSLFFRIVSFSWGLTIAAATVVVMFIASGVFYVVDWIDSLGPRYSAAEFYDEDRFEIVVKEGDRVVYDTYLDKVGAWDHDDCAGLTGDDAIQDGITGAGCETGIEAVYDRSDLGYTVYQRVLEFGDPASATTALDALGEPRDLGGKLGFSEPYPDDAKFGALADAAENFLIVTVIALTPEAEDNRDEAEEGIDTFHTSNLNFLTMDTL